MDKETSNSQNTQTTDCVFNDVNTSGVFTVTPSKNEECYVVEFHSKPAFDEMADKLTELYDFKDNNKSSAIRASTTAEGRLVVLTLYKNQKLMIQGGGGKTWKSTIFQQLYEGLIDSPQPPNNDMTPIRKPVLVQETPFPPKISKTSSPLGFLNRLFNPTVSSPTSDYSLSIDSTHQVSPIFKKKKKQRFNAPQNYKQKGRTPENYKKTVLSPENNKNRQSASIQQHKDIVVVDDEITYVKQAHEEKHNSSTASDLMNIQSDSDKSLSKEPEKVTDEFFSPQQVEAIGKADENENCTKINKDNANIQEHLNCACEQYVEDLDICKSKLLAQEKENKELQSQLRDVIGQSKLIRSENERLLQVVEKQEKEIRTTKASLSKENEKSKKCEMEIRSLKEKLSEETAQTLLLEEENKKFRKDIDRFSKEKSSLVTQLTRTNGVSDRVEEKIENEIQDLKDILLNEIRDLRSQFEKSVTVTGSWSPVNALANENSQSQQEPRTLESTTNRQEQPAAEETFKVFIAGDSVTGALSRNKMSDSKMQVRIKSHHGGKLQDIENTIIKLAEEDEEFICNLNAVVLHGGTNNLSDGESTESVINQYSHLAETIKCINSSCKIIISSILPWKNNRLANQMITQTNQSIKQMCETNSYHFLDNSEKILEDGTPNESLYRDNIHLNNRGGKIFGETICHRVRSILNLTPCPAQTPNRQEQVFPTGRITGRWTTRNRNNNNRQNQNNGYNNRNNISQYKRNNNNQDTNNQNRYNNNYSQNNNNRTRNNQISNTYNKQQCQQPAMMFMPMPFPSWFQQNSN